MKKTMIVTTASKGSIEQTTSLKTFELALPTEFDIKPDFVVPVSKFLEIHIFKIKEPVSHRRDREATPQDGYRLLIIDVRTGSSPSRFRHEDSFHYTELDVAIRIKAIANEVAPKQRRTVERDEEY